MTELTDLDANANARLEAIVAAGEAGKAELERVEKDVEAKCLELGPRLETPQGQRELQDYVEQRLGQARTVINEAMATADDNARQTRELTDRYAGVGLEPGNSGAGTSSGGDTSSGAGGGPAGTTTSGTDTGTRGAADEPAASGAAPPWTSPNRPSNPLPRPTRSARECRWARGCRSGAWAAASRWGCPPLVVAGWAGCPVSAVTRSVRSAAWGRR